MNFRNYMSRRSVLKTVGISGALALGAGTVSARHSGKDSDSEPNFFARLSDNPSIPGHDKVNSRGKGSIDFLGGEAIPLGFELSVRDLMDHAFEINIRSVDGPHWVQLFGPENSGAIVEGNPFNNGTISGEIEDGDVDLPGNVSELIWKQLLHRNGVVEVHTEFEPSGEIVGIIRPRPVNEWIAV